jgi:DNA-binding NtrC family response regulator
MVILIYSAYPSVEALTATMRSGSVNFIDKNEDLSALKTSLERACQDYEKNRKVKPLLTPDEITTLIRSIGMVGCSPKLGQVAESILRFRESKKPVLILGETGVGKEMVATALHGGTKDNFFVVNCAAFQGSSLVESELFGHEKGAFTGAINRKIGILEAARGGTVYLDEIQHLDTQTQGKLLRALREMKIRRVGGLREEPVSFRLIASCWPDIEQRVEKGTFLPDLYYRLKFLAVTIPPLRERIDDIEPLVIHFCQRHNRETGDRKQFLARTIRYLETYDWPGNVGELDGYVAALITHSKSDTVDINHVDPQLKLIKDGIFEGTLDEIDARSEREKRRLIRQTLDSAKSTRQAARILGIKPSSLHTLLDRFGLREG